MGRGRVCGHTVQDALFSFGSALQRCGLPFNDGAAQTLREGLREACKYWMQRAA